MNPTTSVTATQTAGAVGRMVAIEAETIKGDVYVERISQVQIVMLTAEGREKNPSDHLQLDTRPYVGLPPYRASDEALFRGREKETRQIVEAMYTQNLLVVYGHAGVGKTSLLAAGVSPYLAREGALPIQIQDYEQPEKTIRDALTHHVPKLSPELSEDISFSTLFDALISKIKGTVVLILDQFELLFESRISNDARSGFIAALAELVRTTDPRFLRVIIATRTDALEKVGEIERQIPSLLQSPFQLSPLTREQADKAIVEPLLKIKPETKTIFEENLVELQLLPDLDDLTDNDQGFIHPQHLQIVCDTLYVAAESRGQVRVITSKLYTEQLKGADGILASFMRRMMLTRIKEDQIDIALQVLAVMASPGASRWMEPTDFMLRDIDAVAIEDILKRLVDAKILVEGSDIGKKYALVNQMISRELRQLAGTAKEVEEKLNAQDELERIWHTWLDLEHFASPEQLRYLARAGGHLEPRAVKNLLMLRSAIEADTETSVWLDRLRGNKHGQQRQPGEGRELINELESNRESRTREGIGRTTLVNARRLLGFSDGELSDASRTDSALVSTTSSFGALAEKAVSADSSAVRRTCAVALAALGPQETISRLEAALQTIRGSRRRRVLRLELRGVLAEADAQLAELNSKLSPFQRLSIWTWRARRQISRNRRRLVRLTFGGAIGAGITVGLLRAWLALPTENEYASQELWIFFFLAAVLAAPLCWATALAQVISYTNLQTADSEVGNTKNTVRVFLLSTIFGTIAFGVAHSILYWLNIQFYSDFVIGAPYIILMGFAAGLGLSMGLSLPIPSQKFPTWIDSVARIGIAAITLVLVDQFFVSVRHNTSDTVLHTQITLSSDVLRGLTELEDPPFRLRLFTFVSSDAQILAILHAVLTGGLMMIGILLGLRQAKKALPRHE